MKKRILILSHDNKIGDAIVMTGLFKPLRAHWPDSDLGVLCGASNAALYRHHPEVKWLHIASSRNVFARMWASLKARMVRYDMVVHFGLDLANPSVQMVLNMVRAKQRFLFMEHPSPQPNDVVMSGDWGYSAHGKAPHYSARHLRFLQTLGATPKTYHYDIRLGPDAPAQPAQHTNVLMVINSQSSTSNRSLSLVWMRIFLELATQHHPHIRIQLLSASAAHENEQAKMFADLAPQVTVTAFSPNVGDSLQVIQAATIVVSPDTYAVHAASAWNIPVVALYEPSSLTMDLWRPLSDAYVQLCASEGKAVSDIEAGEVVQAMTYLLANPKSRERLFLKQV